MLFDASEMARVPLGASIYSNMMIFGAAWQRGLIPLSHEAIADAIRLNGAAVARTLRAFELGRWAALHPAEAERMLSPKVVQLPKTLEEKIAFRADHLIAYQGKRLAKRYRKLVDKADDPRMKEAVAKGYHKLLAYKDEYEVARLLLSTQDKAAAQFEGDFRMTFHMAPPILSKMGADGRPVKRSFGPWMLRPLKVLAGLKRLRGTPLDIFGRTDERRMERALIKQFEGDMAEVLPAVTPETMEIAVALAELPLQIRGFGPVKQANEAKAAKRREELLAAFRDGGSGVSQAAE